jgi:regulator of protease activity HflC (stomatin/prohibitin superfamily)
VSGREELVGARGEVLHAADGEKQAADALLEAARMLAQQPEAMQLRYLQTMTQVAGDRGATVVFPMPTDLLGTLLRREPK